MINVLKDNIDIFVYYFGVKKTFLNCEKAYLRKAT